MNPSTSFKRGDRVKATNTLFKMHGTVVSIGAFTGLVRVRWDARDGMYGLKVPTFTEYVHPRHLALLSREVSQETFSKGDVVEIVYGHPSKEYVGALGVVVEILATRPASVPRIQVKPYKPSKPFEKLSNGPFIYSASELKARRATGLVPVNFVREALGLLPVVTPGGRVSPNPQSWTLVGTTVDGGGVYTAPSGTPWPPKVADIVDVKGTPRGLEATFQVPDEVSAWLDALTQPTSIRISPAMRRRGVTTEGDIVQIADANQSLTRRNGELNQQVKELKARADRLKGSLEHVRLERDAEASRARDYADVNQALRRDLRLARDQADRLKADLGRYQRQDVARFTAQLFGATVPQLQDELHRAHVSRQQAENERDEAEVRDLKNQLGSAVNRSRRRGEAIERIQNAVRGL